MDKLTTDRLKAWTEHFVQFEGCIDFLYLDGAGIVTIGIGCTIPDIAALPLVRRSDNIRASRPEIFTEFNAIKALPSGKPASYYGKVARLYLPDSEIQSLFRSRLQGFITAIEQSVTSLNGVPESACLALVDMAFNLGIAGLKAKFPHFMNAFVAKDWKTCALECKRNGIQAERNEWTRQVFESLA